MKKAGKVLLVIVLVCAIAAAGYAAGRDAVVYVTKTGDKYHSEGCASVSKSKIAISLGDVVKKGYRPCQRCKPPTLDEEK